MLLAEQRDGALALHGGSPAITHSHPHNDLCAFTSEDKEAVTNYINHPDATLSYYGCEGELAVLEKELADFFDQQYCVCTNSGTNALHSAYFGLGLEPGDEVIASVNTFLATVTPLIGLGVVPVLADIEEDTGNIDPAAAEQLITGKTRAIAITHHAGHPAEMDAFLDIAKRHDLRIVEDVSLAVGATYKGRRAGSFGDAVAVSLGATKLLSGGQGGAMLTNSEEVKDRANLLGHFARRSAMEITDEQRLKFASTGYGHNYRMHSIAVAIARAKLGRVDELIAKRRERYQRFIDGLAGISWLITPVTRPYVDRGQWQYLNLDYRAELTGVPLERLAEALTAEGAELEVRGHHGLLHETAMFQTADDGYYSGRPFSPGKRVYRHGDFPVAERYIARQLGLPMFLHEPMELVDQYVDAFQKVASNIHLLRAD
ncbi:DegT/DnrJ/EryC1/StrS family aminotransferase [Actinoplanes sp. NPDC020271]|uniref:DegT/DnrJ/EryC1/StrS family aminotransferase n=1 Tax=Actinoplanes sp. NPDC020271 TaxID=3363896 RepID=UPI00379928A1